MVLIATAFLFAACNGDSSTNASKEQAPVPAAADELPEDVMENIEMHLWPSNAAPRQGQKPLLSIRARRFMGSVGSGSEWTFEDADAEAPAQDDQHTTIRFKATRGVFLEDKRAVLEGGVTAYIDEMTIYLEDITWEIGNEGGKAFSNNPIRIDSPTQQLNATRMTLDPETALLDLEEVSGDIYFGGNNQ